MKDDVLTYNREGGCGVGFCANFKSPGWFYIREVGARTRQGWVGICSVKHEDESCPA